MKPVGWAEIANIIDAIAPRESFIRMGGNKNFDAVFEKELIQGIMKDQQVAAIKAEASPSEAGPFESGPAEASHGEASPAEASQAEASQAAKAEESQVA